MEKTPHRVIKTITFCYGHRLWKYSGKCKNLHGHNGKIEIVLRAKRLDATGMVADFTEIKEKIKAWVDGELDHRMLLCRQDPLHGKLSQLDSTVIGLPFNPTAESIARMIFEKVESMKFPVSEIRLWETETSCAIYSK